MGPRVVKFHQIDWKEGTTSITIKNPKFSIPDFGTGVGNNLPLAPRPAHSPAQQNHSLRYLEVKFPGNCCKYITADGSVWTELFVR